MEQTNRLSDKGAYKGCPVVCEGWRGKVALQAVLRLYRGCAKLPVHCLTAAPRIISGSTAQEPWRDGYGPAQ